MSSSSVFESLRELFPQVDLRMLRAISIEHRDDINEAIEFILSEFSPSASITSELPHIFDDSREQEQVPPKGSERVEPIPGSSISPLDTLHGIGEAQRLEVFDHDNNLSLNVTHLPEKVDEILFNNADNQLYHLELQERDKVFLAEHHVDAVEVCQPEDNSSVNFVDQTNLSAVYDKTDSTDACRPFNLLDLETAVNTETSTHSVSAVDENEQIYLDSTDEIYMDNIDSENQKFVSLHENSMELLSNENENSNILLSSLHSRSGHPIDIDLLEESILDAKNSKKTLLSTLESMEGMMQEIELLEEKAKQVKADNVAANHDILSKAEDFQKILKQSKDENDMHSGEVYGERSILAAEARELQSRLLKMSEERNEYLSITEELFRALEARKAAAENEIAALELQSQEREKSFHKALEDRDSLLDHVRAESRKLQQEAEENSKLREFLMERGRAVDSLQGEIAVICEDILSMKLKVNGHMPLAKSLRSCSADHISSNAPDHSRSSLSTSLTKEIAEKHPQAKDGTDSVGKNSLDDWELCET